jgi:hypothetical protein
LTLLLPPFGVVDGRGLLWSRPVAGERLRWRLVVRLVDRTIGIFRILTGGLVALSRLLLGIVLSGISCVYVMEWQTWQHTLIIVTVAMS